MAKYKRFVFTAFDTSSRNTIFLTESFEWTEEIGLAWMIEATEENLSQVFRVYDKQNDGLEEGIVNLSLKFLEMETVDIPQINLARLRKKKVLNSLSEDDRRSLSVTDPGPDEGDLGIA